MVDDEGNQLTGLMISNRQILILLTDCDEKSCKNVAFSPVAYWSGSSHRILLDYSRVWSRDWAGSGLDNHLLKLRSGLDSEHYGTCRGESDSTGTLRLQVRVQNFRPDSSANCNFALKLITLCGPTLASHGYRKSSGCYGNWQDYNPPSKTIQQGQ